ncbi:MAG: undecaprenyl-diphosphate phosphatase [Cyanobacteria bacterium J055]|nr:MAG: undecaprenyl-diphosphate phosphatase [Cyanobacteria bacterium J055]
MSISIRQLLTFSALSSVSTVLCVTLDGLAAQTATTAAVAPVSPWTPNAFQAIVLGMVQGLTEFIPISSTGHLKVVPEVLQWGDPGVAFTAVIQLGSIAAVLWYFWNDLVQVTTGAWQAVRSGDRHSQEFRMALGIALGTLPIVFFGLLIKFVFNEVYESSVRTLSVIAIVSIVMGGLLGVAERICSHKRSFENLTMQDGILMGLAQAMALVPGVSRSGSTITAGMFLGLERATAARFSFLLGIPAITLAGLVELKGAIGEMAGVGWMPLAAGTISAAVFSYMAIAWLIRYLQTQSTWVFVWYRIAFGVAILAAIAGGALENG